MQSTSSSRPVVLPLTGDNLSYLESQEGRPRELADYSRAVERVDAELADAYASIGAPAQNGRSAARPGASTSLAELEESSARYEQIESLRREYARIAALPAAEAASFLSTRADNSATALQTRWRSMTARRAFRAAVQRAALARRVAAATRIQRAARVRRTIAREAGPPISSDALARLSATVGHKAFTYLYR